MIINYKNIYDVIQYSNVSILYIEKMLHEIGYCFYNVSYRNISLFAEIPYKYLRCIIFEVDGITSYYPTVG